MFRKFTPLLLLLFIGLAVLSAAAPIQAQQSDSVFTNQTVWNDRVVYSESFNIGYWDALGLTFEVHNDSGATPATGDSLHFRLLMRYKDAVGGWFVPYRASTTDSIDTVFTDFAGKKSRIYHYDLNDIVPKTASSIQFIIWPDSVNVDSTTVINAALHKIKKSAWGYFSGENTEEFSWNNLPDINDRFPEYADIRKKRQPNRQRE